MPRERHQLVMPAGPEEEDGGDDPAEMGRMGHGAAALGHQGEEHRDADLRDQDDTRLHRHDEEDQELGLRLEQAEKRDQGHHTGRGAEDRPAEPSRELPRQEQLHQPAGHARPEVQQQEAPRPRDRLDEAAAEPESQQVAHEMHQAAVEELEREEPPDLSLLDAFDAEHQVPDDGGPEVDFVDLGRREHGDQRGHDPDRHGPRGSGPWVPHVISVGEHGLKLVGGGTNSTAGFTARAVAPVAAPTPAASRP